MSRIIYLDLDNMLIDSVKRFEAEYEAAAPYGITKQEYWNAFNEASVRFGKGGINFETIYAVLKDEHPELPREFITDVSHVLNKSYFFPDTLRFLMEFPKREMAVLTEGGGVFQWPKIRAHQLQIHVGCIIITAGRPKYQMMHHRDRSPVFLLDDAPRVLDEMKTHRPEVICIQMRQVPVWETQKESRLADAHFDNLHDAAEFIKSNS